ncbi:MAG: VirB4 family type IV secretion system protein, partial [Salinirussus sp.]
TLDALENRIEDLQAEYEYLTEKQRASARGVEKDLADHQDLYDTLRNTPTAAFDVSMYLSVRGNGASVDTSEVRTAAQRSPANLTPITPRWSQLDTLVSASPIAIDALEGSIGTKTPMLGGAIGAMFPFVSSSFSEPGIEYGTYAVNGSPFVMDRFERETGYCSLVIGRLGAGKSFATKLRLLRRRMFDEDTMIVMLDPMRGFDGISAALDGERVTVGGTRGLNPLEIRPTPDSALATIEDLDPWGEQLTWVMAFFETFFSEISGHPLRERSQTLRRAVQETYRWSGITRDPATHGEPSPTIHDLLWILESMAEAPGQFGYKTEGEQRAVRGEAESLLKDLRPSFRPEGALSNLGKRTELELDSTVLYLDLHQEEGTQGRAETTLLMQVLFNTVYERVKQSDCSVLFAIDEAHYLLNDTTSLDVLETAVRHSRHFDLGIEFITQTGGEFTLTPQARAIANLCSITVIHRLEEDENEIARWFDLNDRQVEWIRSAKAGEDRAGYAEALVGVDQEGWYPLRIRASDQEATVIDGTAGTEER